MKTGLNPTYLRTICESLETRGNFLGFFEGWGMDILVVKGGVALKG